MLQYDAPELVHTFVVGTLAYAGMVIWLRVSGKRTLSQWNAFDAVVTIALGSMLATVALSREHSLVQALSAFALFVALQFVVTWLAVRSGLVRRLVKARPTLLVRDGRVLHDTLRRERVTQGEVLAAIRDRGIAGLRDVRAVVLETSGTFSVIGTIDRPDDSALSDVRSWAPVGDVDSVGESSSSGSVCSAVGRTAVDPGAHARTRIGRRETCNAGTARQRTTCDAQPTATPRPDADLRARFRRRRPVRDR